MALSLRHLPAVLFPTIAVIHLQVSPFTKVEESFNIQAIHDILEYGLPTSNISHKFETFFDHMTFPGAVPRTFIGSLILSGLAKPQIWLSDLDGKVSQFLVRAVLGGMNGAALAIYGSQVKAAFGPIAASWYVALQASQFHVWYYASRTLPNMFAFFLSTLALALLIPNPTSALGPLRRNKLGLYLLTVATIIFRSELAILLAAQCVWLFLKSETFEGKVLLIRKTFIPSILPGALVALLMTVSIDTYFWQSPTYLWPELSAFLANVFPSKDGLGASAWGTQPWYWYFVVAIPRLLMNQTFMVYLFFLFPHTLLDGRLFDILIPSFVYMIIYSILPHKETRFMFPVVPPLTLVAALTCTRLTISMHKSAMAKVLLYAIIASTAITAFVSHAILLPLSARNYPGGHALEALHAYYYWEYKTITPIHKSDPSHPQVHVHLTNLALQSGVTRFLEQPQLWDDVADDTTETSNQPIVKGFHNPNQNDKRDPIILPGDGNHPALTIHPKPTSSSSPPDPPSKHSYTDTTWIYDKTPSTNITTPNFWSTLDFLIIESPTTLTPPLLGPWKTAQRITSLSSRPILVPPPTPSDPLDYYRRYDPPFTSTLSEHLDYWTTWTDYEGLPWLTEEFDPNPYEHGRGGTTWLLREMYPSWLAIPLVRMHDLLHDLIRLDLNLTRGKWIELPLVTKLYILRNCASGGIGCEDAVVYPLRDSSADLSTRDKQLDSTGDAIDDQEPILIDAPTGDEGQKRLVNNWDELGPLVVNKDGSLSRLENWGDMNGQERRKTVEYLRRRNMLRMEGDGEGDEVQAGEKAGMGRQVTVSTS